ncbi:unnamed protein product [Psylliodes chrysocephalus]|uniref:Uncharacterized protein n=1 Tax=Psylliodes chrysocephalus TaxID=3402493 RepID=A0A9P0GHQ6_9CUCU|nr:unnamed protein product [Psylliodes chrysocephala]
MFIHLLLSVQNFQYNFYVKMESSVVLQDIKNCILQYQYPLANSMSDEDLGDIFKPSNRCFLISWMLKLVGYYDVGQNEKNVYILGQRLYENGFCTKKERLPFMNGTLNTSEQFKILQRIFAFIKNIKDPVNNTHTEPVSFNELENLFQNNTNLFPMFGEIKILDEHKTNKLETENQNGIYKENIMRSNNYNVPEMAEDIQLDLSNMKNLAESYERPKNISDSSIIFDQETLDEFKKCYGNIKLIAQFMKDIHTIEEFTNNTEDILGIGHKTNDGLLKDICEEICIIIRHQKL